MPHRHLLLALLGAALIAAAPTTAPTDRVRKHLGDATVDALRHVTRGEAVRVGNVDPTRAGQPDTVAARAVPAGGAKPVALAPETLARLTAALLSDDTYFRSDSKGTKTGVGYRLWTDGGECVEVSCCLVKGNVWVVAKDPTGKIVAQGDRRGFRDDPASPMRTIAAQLFPDDAEVQKALPKSAPPRK